MRDIIGSLKTHPGKVKETIPDENAEFMYQLCLEESPGGEYNRCFQESVMSGSA